MLLCDHKLQCFISAVCLVVEWSMHRCLRVYTKVETLNIGLSLGVFLCTGATFSLKMMIIDENWNVSLINPQGQTCYNNELRRGE